MQKIKCCTSHCCVAQCAPLIEMICFDFVGRQMNMSTEATLPGEMSFTRAT